MPNEHVECPLMNQSGHFTPGRYNSAYFEHVFLAELMAGLGRFRARLPGAAGAAAHEGTEYRRLAFGCKLEAMSEAEALFQVLRKSADASAVNAIEQLVRD